MKLYEISDQYDALMDMADDIPADALADTLESIQADFDEKAINVALVIQNLKSDENQLKEEIDRLTSKKRAIKARQDRLREYLLTNMQAIKKINVKSPLINITLKRTPAKIDKSEDWESRFVNWAQENSRDDLLFFYDPEPDTKAIMKALDNGEDIPAKLVSGETVMIK